MVFVSAPALRMGWLLLAVGAVGSWGLLRRAEPGAWPWAGRLFVWALAARVIAALLLYVISPRVWIWTDAGWVQNGGFFIGDGHVYAFNGEWLAERWRMGLFPGDEEVQAISMSKSSSPFNYVVGVLVYWLGYHPLTMAFMNCLFGAWAGVLAYWIARIYLPEPGARLAGMLNAAWPSLFLWSTQNLKEPLSVFLLLLSLYGFLRPASAWRRAPLMLLGAGSLVLLHRLNPFIGPIVAVSVVIGLVLRIRGLRYVLVLGALAGLLLATAPAARRHISDAATAIDRLVFHRPVLELVLDPQRFVETVDYIRRVRMEESRTPFLNLVRLERPSDVLQFLPIGLVGVLTAPMPWTARSGAEGLGAVEMLLWYPLLFFAVRGLRYALRPSSGQQLLLVPTVLISCAIALLEGNVGTLFRHRANVWPLLLFFAAAGLSARSRARVQHGR